MEKNVFIEKLLKAALEDGIEAAEVYTSDHDSFRAMSTTGEITDYAVSSRSGLSLRGLYHGKMGYASTEAYDDDAIAMLIRAVIESAELVAALLTRLSPAAKSVTRFFGAYSPAFRLLT